MSLADTEQPRSGVAPLAHPLDEFYAHAGMKLPPLEEVAGSEMPEPYKGLLVHQGDMTPTLEAFYKSTIHLEVLLREHRGTSYFRQVVLLTENGEKAVEFGAIKILLEQYPAAAQKEILEERLPLGTILARHKITHLSRPKAYARVTADDYIRRALRLEGSHELYARRNTLSTPEMRPLAEIFEILPP